MVMDIFGTVSEKLDKAEMGCHGLVIVLGKAHNFFTWKDEYSIQEQGTLKDKRDLSGNIDFWINRGCEIWHLDLPLKPKCVLTLTANTSMKKHSFNTWENVTKCSIVV